MRFNKTISALAVLLALLVCLGGFPVWASSDAGNGTGLTNTSGAADVDPVDEAGDSTAPPEAESGTAPGGVQEGQGGETPAESETGEQTGEPNGADETPPPVAPRVVTGFDVAPDEPVAVLQYAEKPELDAVLATLPSGIAGTLAPAETTAEPADEGQGADGTDDATGILAAAGDDDAGDVAEPGMGDAAAQVPVGWESVDDYENEEKDAYTFRAVLGEGFVLAEGLTAPTARVEIREMGELPAPTVQVSGDVQNGFEALFAADLSGLDTELYTLESMEWQYCETPEALDVEEAWTQVEGEAGETYKRAVVVNDYLRNFRFVAVVRSKTGAEEERRFASAPTMMHMQAVATIATHPFEFYNYENISDPVTMRADTPFVADMAVVDTEVNLGRVVMPTLEQTGLSAPAGYAGSRVFLGWKRLGQTGNARHYVPGEYYSIKAAGEVPQFGAVWGHQVFVSKEGLDHNDGLSAAAPVRTLGRAYEVLARLDDGYNADAGAGTLRTQNPNANVSGRSLDTSVPGNTLEDKASTGGFVLVDDEANRNTYYNGQIVVCGDFDYADNTEGLYDYITFGDLRALGTGTVAFNDGTGTSKTFAGIADNLGYASGDYVRVLRTAANKFTVQSKTASGTYYYVLKKTANEFAYTTAAGTYYSYGRLSQYSFGLRKYTGTGIVTPRNDGFVVLTGRDEAAGTAYNPLFFFADCARYALGGDTVFQHMTMRFKRDNPVVEGEGYVGGITADGYSLVMGEGLSMQSDGLNTYMPPIYGGGYSYRFNNSNINGSAGNRLGDAGRSSNVPTGVACPSTRVSIFSGRYSWALGGAYGLYVGGPVATYGYGEDNAAVINIHGGTFSSIGGAGNEGSNAYNTYVYVYDLERLTSTGATAGVFGSGGGSTGSIVGDGRSNVLVAGTGNAWLPNIYGGSRNGNHVGDARIIMKGGQTLNLYGGNISTPVTTTNGTAGNIEISILGGKVGQDGTTTGLVIGGCATGSVAGKITVRLLGGTVNGNVFTSGKGDSQQTDKSRYFDSPIGHADPLKRPLTDATDARLKILLPVANGPVADALGNPIINTNDNPVIRALVTSGVFGYDTNYTGYRNDRTYSVGPSGPLLYNDDSGDYYMPQVFSKDFSNVITGYGHMEYPQNEGKYTIMRRQGTLSLATVKATELSIGGNAYIAGSVYGGGNVSAVKGDTDITMTGGTIAGSLFGGGQGGTTAPTIKLYFDNGPFTGKVNFETGYDFEWVGADYFEEKFGWDRTQFNPVAGQVPIDYVNRKIYSPNYDKMGDVNGNATINVTGGTIGDSVYGGGEKGAVLGNATVAVSGATVGGNVFGGGYEGRVEGNTSVSLGGTLTTTVGGYLMGGGYSGNVLGNSTLNITGGRVYKDVAGGGFEGTIGGDVAVTASGTTNTTRVDGNLYGGGYRGSVGGNVGVTIEGGRFTDVYGGGFAGAVGTKTLQNGKGPIASADWNKTEHIHDFDYDLDTGHTQVYIKGGQIQGNVYAGADGVAGYTLVYGTATLNMEAGTVLLNLYGGSRSSDDGTGGENDNRTFVNMVGGTVRGNVFGGGFYGMTTGSVHVHVGQGVLDHYCGFYGGEGHELKPALTPSALRVLGSIYAGGDWGNPEDLNSFENETITGMAHVYVDGTGYDTTSTTDGENPDVPYMNIAGSLYGSGNSCAAGGDTRVTLRGYGTKLADGSASRAMYSLQRAQKLEIFDSYVQLKGQRDAASHTPTALHTIMHIDHMQLISGNVPGQTPGSTLLLDNPVNDVEMYSSLQVVGDPLAALPTVQLVGHDELNTYPNRIVIREGASMVVAGIEVDGGTRAYTYDFGPVNGYTYLETPADSRAYVYARPKWTGNETGQSAVGKPGAPLNANDGGFVSEDAALNIFDEDGNRVASGMQLPYTNKQTYRLWTVGAGANKRSGTIVAQVASGNNSTPDILTSTASIALPPAETGVKYVIDKIEIDGVELLNGAYTTPAGQPGAGWTTVSPPLSSGSEVVEETPASLTQKLHASPENTFGLVMNTGAGFTGTSTGAILCPFNNVATSDGGLLGQVTDGSTGADNTLPNLDFLLTYSNQLRSTNEVGTVTITLYTVKDGDPSYPREVTEVALTVVTMSSELEENYDVMLYVTPGGSYTGQVIFPSGPTKNMYLKGMELLPSEAANGFNIVDSSTIRANQNQDNDKVFGINMRAAPNPDNTSGWLPAVMEGYELGGLVATPPVPPGDDGLIGTTDSRTLSSISFTLTNYTGISDFGSGDDQRVRLTIEYLAPGETTPSTLTVTLIISKQAPSIDATVPLSMDVVVRPNGDFVVPDASAYTITSYTPAALYVSHIRMEMSAEASDVFSAPENVGMTVNGVVLRQGATVTVGDGSSGSGDKDDFLLRSSSPTSPDSIELPVLLYLTGHSEIYKIEDKKAFCRVIYTLEYAS